MSGCTFLADAEKMAGPLRQTWSDHRWPTLRRRSPRWWGTGSARLTFWWCHVQAGRQMTGSWIALLSSQRQLVAVHERPPALQHDVVFAHLSKFAPPSLDRCRSEILLVIHYSCGVLFAIYLRKPPLRHGVPIFRQTGLMKRPDCCVRLRRLSNQTRTTLRGESKRPTQR